MALMLMALARQQRQNQQRTNGVVSVNGGGLEDAGAGSLVLEDGAAVGLVDELRGHVVP